MSERDSRVRFVENVNKIMVPLSTGTLGLFQVFVENDLLGTAEGAIKFPGGKINFAEEFVEGALPAAVGALTGKLFYRWITTKYDLEKDPVGELYFTTIGAVMGYTGMMIAGHVLHEILDIPDVKWGLFK